MKMAHLQEDVLHALKIVNIVDKTQITVQYALINMVQSLEVMDFLLEDVTNVMTTVKIVAMILHTAIDVLGDMVFN